MTRFFPLSLSPIRKIISFPMSETVLGWAAPLRTLRQIRGWKLRPVPLAQARKILVLRPDEIGDVVLTTAFLRELRHAAPHARIDLIVKHECRELVEHCPYVNAV